MVQPLLIKEERNSMSSEMEFYKKLQNDFLETRTRGEMLVKQWADRLAKVDPVILADVPLPENISLRSMAPALYDDNASAELQLEQWNAVNELIKQTNAIHDKLNKEGMLCLQELKRLDSSK